MPPRKVAVLAIGLPYSARIKRRGGVDIDRLLLAAIADRLGLLVWMKSKDAQRGRNRPASIVAQLMSAGQSESNVRAFDSPEDFEAERRRILGG